MRMMASPFPTSNRPKEQTASQQAAAHCTAGLDSRAVTHLRHKSFPHGAPHAHMHMVALELQQSRHLL
jgi:hypothetical protein